MLKKFYKIYHIHTIDFHIGFMTGFLSGCLITFILCLLSFRFFL